MPNSAQQFAPTTEFLLQPDTTLLPRRTAANARHFLTSQGNPEHEKLVRQMVAEHSSRLYRFVMRYIRHHDEANDIVQNTLAQAACTLDDFRGDSQVSTWLFGIAMNQVRNYLSRSPTRRYAFESEDSLDEMEAPAADPAALIERQEQLSRLSRCIASLPDDMRETLLLVTVDELPYEDVAQRQQIPVGTVRSRVSRARTILRAKMEDLPHL